MRIAAFLAFGLACLGGFYESLSSSWSPAYRLNISLHPALGVLAVVAAFGGVWAARRRKEESAGAPGRWGGVLWGLAGTGLLALLTGWIMASRELGPSSVRWASIHAGAGLLAFAVLFAAAVRVAPRWQGSKRWAALAGLVAVPGIPMLLGPGLDKAMTPEEQTVQLSPLLKHFNESQYASRTARFRSAVGATAGCGGGGGCHGDLVEDLRSSGHYLSVRTPYFRKNLDLLESETGPGKDRMCGGCHFPVGVFRDRSHSNLGEGETYSCAFCHSVSAVALDKDPARSSFMIRPNVNHLELFSESENGPPEKTRRLIRLNPKGHAKVFSKPLYKRDAFCLTCHHLQIKPPEYASQFIVPRCNDCHMQPRKLLGRGGSRRNHAFVGSNTALPAALENPAMVELTQKWLRGDLLLGVQDSFWELRSDSKERPSRAFWLVMTFDAPSPPTAGEDFLLKVITSNVGIGHNFPAAPLDLIEAWLEVKAESSRRGVLFENGKLDRSGRLASDAHRMGGYMLDKDGNKIERNRVWVTAKKVVERAIPPGRTVEDEFRIPVPADVGSTLRVEARWNYRKLNQDFVDWAFGPGNFHAPVSEVASTSHEFEVKHETVQ